MGDLLRLVADDSTEIGHLPHPFAAAIHDSGFRRTLPRDAMGAFMRSAAHPEREHPPTDASTVLAGLLRLEAHEREDRQRRWSAAGVPFSASDLVLLRSSARARLHEARVSTAFIAPGSTWKDRIIGPITAEDPWRDIPEGESRSWVHAVLGPVPVRADGSIVRPGHAIHEGKPRRFEARFEPREQPIELYFVPPAEHPDWQALLAHLAAHPSQRLRFTSW